MIFQIEDFLPFVSVMLIWLMCHLPIYIWLIFWKDPLSSMSRGRIFDRRDLRVKPDECDEVIKVRSFYVDKRRYVGLRRAFLGMKMDYAPTEERIDRLLKRVNKSLERVQRKNLTNEHSQTKKEFIEIDKNILLSMKRDLQLGNLEITNFSVRYESDESSWLKHRSVRTALIWAFVCASPMLMPPFFIVGDWLLISGTLASENVLRRSRDRRMRKLARFVQIAIIVGGLWIIILWPLLYLIGWFDLLGLPLQH